MWKVRAGGICRDQYVCVVVVSSGAASCCYTSRSRHIDQRDQIWHASSYNLAILSVLHFILDRSGDPDSLLMVDR